VARFIQIHALSSFPAALLNRDDSGMAKRMPYGGAMRTRVSSQCLKRHWRKADGPWALAAIGPEMAVRSRKIPEERILPALGETGTVETREAAVARLALKLYGDKAKNIENRQALLLGEPEIAYLTEKARAAAAESDGRSAEAAIDRLFTEERGNLSAMLAAKGPLHAGLEAALFGRMVTSDYEANTDAPIHVAHAFTVHGEEAETDYFTVVDDLEKGTGAGGIFDTELTAGLYYLYVVVDVPLLVANLADDAELAGKVVEHLVNLIATTSPGAKKGSTAPYAYADFLLAEAGDRAPRSLAGAFREPVEAQLRSAIESLTDHLAKIDAMYGGGEERRYAALDPIVGLKAQRATLPDLAKVLARQASASMAA
jgi:CRISPR system Cascade subunit CasC